MTQDEIISMARELATRHGTRMCDEDGETHGEELYCVDVDEVAEIIKRAAAHEREACAKVCESYDEKYKYSYGKHYAAAIRARGN